MRFMVIVPADAESESGKLPDEKILADMGKFNEELVKASVMLAGEGLQPTSKGARLRFSGGKVSVTDGPFTESKELIAGFWLIQVKDKQEAIEWMKRAPFGEGVTLEIRLLFETEDFAPVDPTGELRAQEDRLRAQITKNTKK
ncbi:MAG: YciI family protein [Bacteroidota bacterium]